jgi:hypothetical protein
MNPFLLMRKYRIEPTKLFKAVLWAQRMIERYINRREDERISNNTSNGSSIN